MAHIRLIFIRGAMLLMAACMLVLSGRAETVSQKSASQYARQFFNAANGQVMGEPKVVYNGRRLTTHSLFVPFYVYNFPGGGFVIVSAENKAFPILGYDLREKFDPDNIGPKLKALLTSYARDIERIRYDSRTPYEAIKAWNYFPEYVDALFSAPYSDHTIQTEEADARAVIDAIIANDDPEYASSTYTPRQWQDAVNSELKSRGNAIAGIYDADDFLPVVIHGNRQDFYRIGLDKADRSLFRLFATEYFSDGQVASLGSPIKISEPEEPDYTFRFYDDFIAETDAENERARRKIENFYTLSEPQVSFIGAGHFSIRCPEEIASVSLYNIGGALVNRQTFKDTDTANLDFSVQPSGFYIALIQGRSGKTYGVKLIR